MPVIFPPAGGGGGGGTTDHGSLTGLGDDDHTQYHNDERGDERYYTQTTLDGALAAKAADNNVVHLNGNETVSGIKTFGSIPVIPASDPSNDNQVARKAYVDSRAVAIAQLPAGSTVTVFKSGGVWPARPTDRADIHVIWKGPDPAPTIVSSGTGGMLDNVDTNFMTLEA